MHVPLDVGTQIGPASWQGRSVDGWVYPGTEFAYGMAPLFDTAVAGAQPVIAGRVTGPPLGAQQQQQAAAQVARADLVQASVPAAQQVPAGSATVGSGLGGLFGSTGGTSGGLGILGGMSLSDLIMLMLVMRLLSSF